MGDVFDVNGDFLYSMAKSLYTLEYLKALCDSIHGFDESWDAVELAAKGITFDFNDKHFVLKSGDVYIKDSDDFNRVKGVHWIYSNGKVENTNFKYPEIYIHKDHKTAKSKFNLFAKKILLDAGIYDKINITYQNQLESYQAVNEEISNIDEAIAEADSRPEFCDQNMLKIEKAKKENENKTRYTSAVVYKQLCAAMIMINKDEALKIIDETSSSFLMSFYAELRIIENDEKAETDLLWAVNTTNRKDIGMRLLRDKIYGNIVEVRFKNDKDENIDVRFKKNGEMIGFFVGKEYRQPADLIFYLSQQSVTLAHDISYVLKNSKISHEIQKRYK